MTTQRETLYTVHITFHSAQNLPVADLHNLSCDPYILATITSASSPSHNEAPLTWRTPTLRRTRDPTWNSHWVVSGIPESGCLLKIRVKDEDTRDRDDRLGKAYVSLSRDMMHDGFEINERSCKIWKRKGSFIPWIQTYIAALIPGQKLRKHNRVVVSVKVLGKAADQTVRRIYTVGPNAYSKHFSPLIGSVVNRKDQFTKALPTQPTGDANKRLSASTFVANKLQLTGPVPPDLHLHYVGYNKFIDILFSNSGVLGRLLHHGLRKQYRSIYSYNSNTLYGVVDAADEDYGLLLDSQIEVGNGEPQIDGGQPEARDQEANKSKEKEHDRHNESETRALAKTFLNLTKWGTGGSLYTYVITLDAEWRFSETGDEFAIDFLSKHMMHANGARVVMFSGEFFVRRISENEDDGGEEGEEGQDEDRDPSNYELIIDNNSGTYRPPTEKLPALKNWLADRRRLGGLGRVTVMDAFDEKLKDLKAKRKEYKKRLAGGELPQHKVAMRQGSSVSSIRLLGLGKISSREVEEAITNGREPGDGETREQQGKTTAKQSCQHMDNPSASEDSGVHI